MTDTDPPSDRAFRTQLATRLTELRLAIDLGEVSTPAEFRARLERGGAFSLDDPRVRNACVDVGLSRWVG